MFTNMENSEVMTQLFLEALQGFTEESSIKSRYVKKVYSSQVLKRLGQVRTIKKIDVERALLEIWQSVSSDDVKNVVRNLEETGKLKKIGQSSWEVIFERTVNKPITAPVRIVPVTPHYLATTKKSIPGICLRCGKHTGYKNRHARKDSAHTVEECMMNQIRSVMEELRTGEGGRSGDRRRTNSGEAHGPRPRRS